MPPPGGRPPTLRALGAALGAALLVALIIWGFVRGRGEAAIERAREAPVAAPSRVHERNGTTVVVLDSPTQARSGIVVAPAAAGRGGAVSGYGSVVPLDTLAALHDAYVAAASQAAQARARLDASRRENERLGTLYRDDQNVSARVLETARATSLADQAAAETASDALRTIAARARQDWGPVVGGWITRGSAEFDRLLARRELLVQVTVPPDVAVDTAPATAVLASGPGQRVVARFVSAAARTDPRIQGMSFFYLAPASAGLLPGTNVAASLGTASPGAGTSRGRAAVPDSAVVWSEGAPWVYVRAEPTAFVRRRIQIDAPAAGGGYLVASIAPGTPIVVRGAQLLLSEEFRSQIQVGTEGRQQ